MKTKKAIAKRFKITATGRIFHRPVHQDHFNAKDTGKKRRQKRKRKEVTGPEAKYIKKWLPYA